MKKIGYIFSTLAIGVTPFISSCSTFSTSANAPLSKLYQAAIFDSCLSNLESQEKGTIAKLTASNIDIRSPNANDLTNLISILNADMGGDAEKVSNYATFLDGTPYLKIATVDLKGNKNMQCEYAFFDNNKGELKKLPILISVKSGNAVALPPQKYIQAVTLKDYAFSYFQSKHGVKYSNITASNHYKATDNKNIIPSLRNQLTQATLSGDNLQPLDVNTNPEISGANEQELALNATKDLYYPQYTPENPIYLTSIVTSRQIQMIGNFQASDRNVKEMDKFNENRYVDPDTGIETRRDVLQVIQNEYGIKEGDAVEMIANKMKSADIKSAPESLRLKGDEYVEDGGLDDLKMKN
ncbi:hypothetical protein [Acinetobacter sp. P1(2025)]|uniref:hypothetical protein n=1 Tax=Acinetobacter sp. P1(2025) TaxID=3446120 RepID=UPI003F5352D6